MRREPAFALISPARRWAVSEGSTLRASLGVLLFIAGLSLLVETYALPSPIDKVVGTTTAGLILAVCELGALATSLLVDTPRTRNVGHRKLTAD